jgi:hypothetical protein
MGGGGTISVSLGGDLDVQELDHEMNQLINDRAERWEQSGRRGDDEILLKGKDLRAVTNWKQWRQSQSSSTE